jgi:hypothetical protein
MSLNIEITQFPVIKATNCPTARFTYAHSTHERREGLNESSSKYLVLFRAHCCLAFLPSIRLPRLEVQPTIIEARRHFSTPVKLCSRSRMTVQSFIWMYHVNFLKWNMVYYKKVDDVGTTHNESSASQSQASNQPMLGNGGVNSRCWALVGC